MFTRYSDYRRGKLIECLSDANTNQEAIDYIFEWMKLDLIESVKLPVNLFESESFTFNEHYNIAAKKDYVQNKDIIEAYIELAKTHFWPCVIQEADAAKAAGLSVDDVMKTIDQMLDDFERQVLSSIAASRNIGVTSGEDENEDDEDAENQLRRSISTGVGDDDEEVDSRGIPRAGKVSGGRKPAHRPAPDYDYPDEDEPRRPARRGSSVPVGDETDPAGGRIPAPEPDDSDLAGPPPRRRPRPAASAAPEPEDDGSSRNKPGFWNSFWGKALRSAGGGLKAATKPIWSPIYNWGKSIGDAMYEPWAKKESVFFGESYGNDVYLMFEANFEDLSNVFQDFKKRLRDFIQSALTGVPSSIAAQDAADTTDELPDGSIAGVPGSSTASAGAAKVGSVAKDPLTGGVVTNPDGTPAKVGVDGEPEGPTLGDGTASMDRSVPGAAPAVPDFVKDIDVTKSPAKFAYVIDALGSQLQTKRVGDGIRFIFIGHSKKSQGKPKEIILKPAGTKPLGGTKEVIDELVKKFRTKFGLTKDDPKAQALNWLIDVGNNKLANPRSRSAKSLSDTDQRLGPLINYMAEMLGYDPSKVAGITWMDDTIKAALGAEYGSPPAGKTAAPATSGQPDATSGVVEPGTASVDAVDAGAESGGGGGSKTSEDVLKVVGLMPSGSEMISKYGDTSKLAELLDSTIIKDEGFEEACRIAYEFLSGETGIAVSGDAKQHVNDAIGKLGVTPAPEADGKPVPDESGAAGADTSGTIKPLFGIHNPPGEFVDAFKKEQQKFIDAFGLKPVSEKEIDVCVSYASQVHKNDETGKEYVVGKDHLEDTLWETFLGINNLSSPEGVGAKQFLDDALAQGKLGDLVAKGKPASGKPAGKPVPSGAGVQPTGEPVVDPAAGKPVVPSEGTQPIKLEKVHATEMYKTLVSALTKAREAWGEADKGIVPIDDKYKGQLIILQKAADKGQEAFDNKIAEVFAKLNGFNNYEELQEYISADDTQGGKQPAPEGGEQPSPEAPEGVEQPVPEVPEGGEQPAASEGAWYGSAEDKGIDIPEGLRGKKNQSARKNYRDIVGQIRSFVKQKGDIKTPEQSEVIALARKTGASRNKDFRAKMAQVNGFGSFEEFEASLKGEAAPTEAPQPAPAQKKKVKEPKKPPLRGGVGDSTDQPLIRMEGE